MTKNSETAKYLSDLFLSISGELNESIEKVEETCSPDEFKTYRSTAGRLINSIFENFLEPIYRAHPTLKPPELEM